MNRKEICVVGLGYIGLPLAAILASNNFKVIGYDINLKKINLLQNKSFLTNEDNLNKLLKSRLVRKNLTFTSKSLLANTYMICVQTPLSKKTKRANIAYILQLLFYCQLPPLEQLRIFTIN